MYTASGALAAAALLFLAACSLARSSAFFCFVASSLVKASMVAATSPYNSWRSSGLISPARAFARRLTDEVASTGDWSGAVGGAAGVVGARRRVALWRLPGAGSGGGASAGVGSGAGSGPDRRLRAPRRAVVPGSGSAGASAGVIFLCFLLAIATQSDYATLVHGV